MNIFKKLLSASLLVAAMCTTPLWAQEAADEGLIDTTLTHYEQNNPQSGYGVDVTNFVPVPACYVGGHNLFVVIDSIDNAVDIITRPNLDTVRFVTDEYKGRHDLVNILRPVSVGFCDGYVVVLANAKKDSSFLAVLDLNGQVVNRVDFNCCSYAFHCYPDEIVVMGKNPQGYDISILSMANGLEQISTDPAVCERIHYHKPKQADRIREADPIGIGLTCVAVAVVFLALLCISLIIKGYGKLIMKTQDRKANKNKVVSTGDTTSTSAAETSGEIYAAIATAIYLYDEEMHDDENTVITIQKVERAWTPWNAKFYNMNQYNRNKR